MSREEFIGKLEMVYVGDRNAFNDIVCAYDSVLSANEKAIEYVTSEEYYDLNNKKTGSFSEDSKNYFIAHDKLLNILQNGSEEKY